MMYLIVTLCIVGGGCEDRYARDYDGNPIACAIGAQAAIADPRGTLLRPGEELEAKMILTMHDDPAARRVVA